MENLSNREKEVLVLVVQGLKTKDIADQLHVCTDTIKAHRKNLMRKFEVNNIASVIHQYYTTY